MRYFGLQDALIASEQQYTDIEARNTDELDFELTACTKRVYVACLLL